MSAAPDWSIQAAMQAADEAGIKLEMVEGIPVWESMPSIKHQRAVDRIRQSMQRDLNRGSDCGCVNYSDINIKFKDGSFKRPDVSVFCNEPEEEGDNVVTLPEAVIEIVTKGYEAKDYEFGLPFYLKIGVKDVIIFDPSRNHVLHARRDGTQELTSPAAIQLECGCICTV